METEYEYKEIKKRFFHRGSELASFAAKYPCADEHQRIWQFYEGLLENAYAWFCGEFLEGCREEYENSADKTRRFEREALRYSADFLAKEEGDLLLVSLDIVLKKGKKNILCELHEAHLWDKETELRVRPKEKNRV